MEEIKKLYFTIPEAAKKLSVNQSKLRYWDSEYKVVSIRGTATKNRKITPKEMILFTKIKLLSCIFNSEGIKQVLKGKIKVTINNDLIVKYE